MRGLYTAASALLAGQVILEVISNNLANQNTPGYREDRVACRAFPEVLIRRVEKGSGDSGPIGSLDQGVAVEEVFTPQRPGPLESTGRMWDLAVVGEGFFTILTEEGIRYTRNGHFHVNADGYLVTDRGDLVMGTNGPLQPGGAEARVGPDGMVYVGGDPLDQLQLAFFAPQTLLRKDGSNLFALEGPPLPAEQEGEVRQGFLENSNVDLPRQVVGLMEVRRRYESAQKVVQAYDQLLSHAANELGILR